MISSLPSFFPFPPMNVIDFRELRRMERKKARSLHKWRNNCCIPDQNLDQEGIDVPDQSLPTNDPTISTTIRLPFQTLLQNELAEYHRIHPPRSKIDSVYYVKHFLPDDICQEFLQWLQTLPEYSRESKFLPLDERDESKKCNGKWTTLKHARRRGTGSQCIFIREISPSMLIISIRPTIC